MESPWGLAPSALDPDSTHTPRRQAKPQLLFTAGWGCMRGIAGSPAPQTRCVQSHSHSRPPSVLRTSSVCCTATPGGVQNSDFPTRGRTATCRQKQRWERGSGVGMPRAPRPSGVSLKASVDVRDSCSDVTAQSAEYPIAGTPSPSLAPHSVLDRTRWCRAR
jgi:hypothetical protein